MRIHQSVQMLLLMSVCLGLAACADSVAPGYRIEKQNVAVRYDAGTIHIHAEYRLRNTGSEPLDSLRVSLAAVNPGAALDMRTTVDGTQVTWEHSQQDGLPALAIRFPVAWARRARKQLVLDYSFQQGGGVAAPSFQLLPGSWSPELLPPPGMLSKGGAAPKNWDLSVHVPKEMVVHSAGKNRGVKKRGDTVEYRFRQEKSHGFTYVVGGPFQETRVDAGDFVIHFWSLQPITHDAARTVAAGLEKTLETYRAWLGPLDKDARDIWVMDGSASRYILAGPAGSLPGLAADMIIDPALFVGGQARSESYCIADEWLAGIWVNWLAHPEKDARALAENLAKHLAQSLPDGCAYSLYNARSREAAMQQMRQAFARANKYYQDENGRLKESFRRERDGYLQRLKVFAIEERAGREPFQRALRRVVQALRGRSWGQNELRSALEAETGQDWAAFFRAWASEDKLPD